MTDQSHTLVSEEQLDGDNAHAVLTAQSAPAASEDVFELNGYATGAQLVFRLLDNEVAAVVEEGASAHASGVTNNVPALFDIDVSDRPSVVLELGSTVTAAFDDFDHQILGFVPHALPTLEGLSHSDITQQEAGQEIREIVDRPASISSGLPSLNSAKLAAGHVVLSADAMELLSLLFSPKELSSTPAVHGQITVAYDSLQFDDAPPVTSQTVQLSTEGSNLQDSSPTPSDRGYKLVEDILAFAFDQSRELSPSHFMLENLSNALEANLFLPFADRVLVIDVPDLRADAFKFADGLVMISQDLAAQLLPDMPLQPQSELSLASGATLKLIGVIDMTPDTQGYIA
jgi:hypothetical protein